MKKIRQRYRTLVYLTWFLTLDLIMFGAFVRLSDAGLGCPDWPGCYGKLSPFGASHFIQEAYLALPGGPVSWFKAWVEMIHRYIGATLGVLIIAIVWMAWRHRRQLGHNASLATFTLFAVCLQGAFGAWTVTHKLMPIIVTAHLLGGMLVLSLMTWLATCATYYRPALLSTRRFRPWLALATLLVFVQIALGGWVSTNYAALACMDFPLCHGLWVPPMDLNSAYSLVRDLGYLPSGERLPQEALTAMHWVHRNAAFVVFAVLVPTAWQLRRDPALHRYASLTLLLLLAQLLTGLSTIFFQWPLVIAVLHNGGAAALVMTCVTMLVRLSPPSLPQQGKRYDDSLSRPPLATATVPGAD